MLVNGQDFGDAGHRSARVGRGGRDLDSRSLISRSAASLLTITAVLLMSMIIAHLLKPIKSVGDALSVLEVWQYDVVVPEKGPPEISDICRKLNRLATTLETTISENRRLAQRIIHVQDEERKDLARELHDELGPYLFAVRAAISAHKAELQRGGADREKLLQTCDTVVERMETIQRMNRGVLQKLRPLGLEEYGLKAKLKSLLALLRESHAQVEINLAVDDDMPPCDETSRLTIYRLVQEGLTNVFRHSDATVVDISIGQALDEEAPPAIRAQERRRHPCRRCRQRPWFSGGREAELRHCRDERTRVGNGRRDAADQPPRRRCHPRRVDSRVGRGGNCRQAGRLSALDSSVARRSRHCAM